MNNRLIKLFTGLILFAFGIYLSLQANVGAAPWDAFHQGLSYKLGISFGQASMLVGFVIVLFNMLFKENIGIGTLANTFIIGLFIDLFYAIDLVPKMNGLASGLFTLFISMVIMSFSTYLYVDAAYGAGPRDGLMIIMVKLTKKPVGLVRLTIESSVCIVGFLMGGQIGMGTVILALCIGPIVQIVFKLLNFKIEAVQHQYLFAKSKRIA